MRLAGRRAGRPGADRHRGRGPRHPRARRAGRRSTRCARRSRASIPTSRRSSPAGCCSAIVIDGGKPEYEQGDFLVRGVIGADPEAGTLTVGAPVAAPARSCACTRATPSRPTATCARRSACGARRSAAARRPARWSSPATGAARRCSATPDHDAMTLDEELAGAPGRGLLRRRRDRPGRRRPVPARVHGHCGSLPAVNLAGRSVLLTGATGGLGHAIARRLRAAGAELVLTGPARRGPRAARRRDAARGRWRSTSPTPRRSSGWPRECADVDVLVANAGPAGLRPADVVQRRGDRPRAGRQPARADGARARARRAHGRARQRPHRLHVLAGGQGRHAAQLGLQRDEVRPARLRAEPARGPAPQRRRRQRDLPRLRPRRGHVPRHGDQAPARRRARCRPRTSPTRSCARSSATAARSTSRRSGCAPAPRRPGWPPTSRRRCSASSAATRIAEQHVATQTARARRRARSATARPRLAPVVDLDDRVAQRAGEHLVGPAALAADHDDADVLRAERLHGLVGVGLQVAGERLLARAPPTGARASASTGCPSTRAPGAASSRPASRRASRACRSRTRRACSPPAGRARRSGR